MKLYFAPAACSLAVHIALREAGMNFELDKVDLAVKKTASGKDFTAISDKGYVPALELASGEVLSETAAILQYIADQAGKTLAPQAGSLERYRMLEWLNYIATELHKSLGALFSPLVPEPYKAFVRETIGRKFDYVEKRLSSGGPYLLGGEFSVADAYLFAVLGWPAYLGISLDGWPQLTAYAARVAARPKVQEAMAAEGLLKNKAA